MPENALQMSESYLELQSAMRHQLSAIDWAAFCVTEYKFL